MVPVRVIAEAVDGLNAVGSVEDLGRLTGIAEIGSTVLGWDSAVGDMLAASGVLIMYEGIPTHCGMERSNLN